MGEKDIGGGKDHILEMFWCKSHYIYPSAFFYLGRKKGHVSMSQMGFMMSEEYQNAHPEPIFVK